MNSSDDIDEMSHAVCSRLKQRFQEVSGLYGEAGNIVGLFFHDLVVHFTGIIIHRMSQQDYGGETKFPWVNRAYALKPGDIANNWVNWDNNRLTLLELVKTIGVVPVASGRSIPLGYRQQQIVKKLLVLFLPNPQQERAFLPNYSDQLDVLQAIVIELCAELDIPCVEVVCKNWMRYAQMHITNKQKKLFEKGVLLGTRNSLHNRKLSVNYLQQEKVVVGFTHGEITNHVLDEPVFGYSDKTLCTTLIDYGTYVPEKVTYPAIIKPHSVKRRTSSVIAKRYQRNGSIEYTSLKKNRILFIPTMYQQNYLYGPKHAYESDKYYKWHVALSECLPNMTVKMHPKSRSIPKFNCNVDFRQLDDCIDEYDVLIFDFFSTAAVLAIFSEKPVIYFDIGLRILDKKFKEHLHNRCSVFEIDFEADWEEQIRNGLTRFEQDQRITTNIGLEQYSLCHEEEFSLPSMLMDIIFANEKFN